MTGAKTRARRNTTGDRDNDALKARVVEAALPHIAFDGLTDSVLNDAARAAGLNVQERQRLFPDGPLSLATAISEVADRDMEAALAKAKLDKMKVRERISTAVKTRISILRPHKEAARRVAAFLTLPPHAPRAVTLLYRTVDAMWRAAGDTSTDFNFYSKRAILAGVYSATMLRWFTDQSENETETDAFLARRIEEVMRFEKFKSQIRERAKHLPSFADILRGPKPGRP